MHTVNANNITVSTRNIHISAAKSSDTDFRDDLTVMYPILRNCYSGMQLVMIVIRSREINARVRTDANDAGK
jgi:hypothetical protein